MKRALVGSRTKDATSCGSCSACCARCARIGLSLVGAVVGELIGANRGLGWYVAKSGGQLDTTGVFTSLLLLMALAMIANQLVVLVEGRLLRWRR